MNFYNQLENSWQSSQSLLCVGLDPHIDKLPPFLNSRGGAIFAFCKEIVDATADLVCAFKPQIAHFAAQNAEDQLEQIISYIKINYPDVIVILDAKRADINSTAKQYAIEAFERYKADAVTINPYLGVDAITPFIEYQDKGIFILCKTSNPSGTEIQDLALSDNTPLYLKIAELAAHSWNKYNNIGLVVGATNPAQIAQVRQRVGNDIPLLIPGIGAQGGDLLKTLDASLVINKPEASTADLPAKKYNVGGVLLNSSRAILYASSDEDFAKVARHEAIKLCSQIQQHISLKFTNDAI